MGKKFFKKNLQAQSSIETIIILAMALFILTALTAMIYDQITIYKNQQEQKIASIAVNTIVKEVNDAYFLGPGTIKTILVRMPNSIDLNKSAIEGRTLVLNVGGADIFASTKVDVRGIWPDESGTYTFTISSFDDYVSVSVRPVDVSPNQVNEYLVQGESKDFSISLTNSSDKDYYYSLILDFSSSSESTLTSTHEGVVELFYGETQTVDFSLSCSTNSFGSYYGKIVFVPNDSSDSNITIPVNLFCSSAQTKLQVYPSSKYFYAGTNSSTTDSVLVCNTTSRDFPSTSTSVSGSIAPYVVTSFSGSISANSCSTIPFTVNAPSSVSNYFGTLIVNSGSYVSGVDLNLVLYPAESVLNFDWSSVYFGADNKSINDINLTTLTGPFTITHAMILFQNDIDDANITGLYFNNQNTFPTNKKAISAELVDVSDFNLGRRKSYDLNITFDANIRNDSEKFRIILKSSEGTYYWSSIFDPTNSIVDNNASHFSNLKKGQEPIYPQGNHLISLWRMDDLNSNSYTTDVLGRNQAHVINATLTKGLWDKNAFNFDESTTYIDVYDNDSLDLTDKWTISAWINRRTMGVQQGIVEKYLWYDGKGVFGLRVTSSDKLVAFVVNGTSSNDCGAANTTLNSGTWYNVVATFDTNTNTLKCYVNGLLDGSNTSADVNPTPGVSSLKIGARGDDATYKFNGLIDDVAIWNVALSAEEVKEIYSIGSGVHDFNIQADGNGLYLAKVGNDFVSDGNFYSRVFDFNGKVDFSQMFFTKSTIGSSAFNLFLKDNNLNNNYLPSSYVSRRVDNNAFVATGELDWNVLAQSSQFVSSNYLYDVNLVSLWHLNDNNSDGWVLNSVSGVRDGNLLNGALLNTTGLWSTNSIYLDGVNDYLAIPDASSSYVSLGGKFTISAWVYPTSISGLKSVFVSGSSGLCFNYGLVLNSGRVYFRNTNNDYSLGGPTLETYKWNHLLLTSNGSTVSGYVNGIFTSTINYASSSCGALQAVIGARALNSATEMFSGNIEEVAIWNKTFSATDANNLYNSQKGIWADSNLIGYWKFNNITSQGLVLNSAQNFRDGKINGTENITGIGDTNSINFTTGTGTFDGSVDLGTDYIIAFTAKNPTKNSSQIFYKDAGTYLGFISYTGGANLYMTTATAGSRWWSSALVTDASLANSHRYVVTKKSGDAFGNMYIDGVLSTGTQGLTCAGLSFSGITSMTGTMQLDELVTINATGMSAGDISTWVANDYTQVIINDIAYNSGATGITHGWHFDEGTGTSSADFVSTKNVTLSGSYSWAFPTISYTQGLGLWDSNAGYFDGTNDFIQTSNYSLPTNSNFTYSVWIKPNFSSYQQPIIHWGSTSPRLYWRVESAGRMYADVSITNPKMYSNGVLFCSSTDCSGVTPAFQNGVWYNLVFTGTYTGTALTNTPILIGSGTPPFPGRYFSGLIDEVKIYNRALSASEIALDYNKVFSSKFVDLNIVDVSSTMNWNSVKVNSDVNYSFGKELSATEKFGDGLVGLWHLNEIGGTTAVADSSGNSNNGTLNAAKSGVTVTTDGNYTIYTFKSSGTFTVSSDMNVSVLVVGGGGSGGGSSGTSIAGGGGGAGGLIYNSNFAVAAGTYNVVVGGGGIGQTGFVAGRNGSDSIFYTLTAKGGGYGGTWTITPTVGGSGGGAGENGQSLNGALGVAGQGYAGGNDNGYDSGSTSAGGGGGGSNGVGADAVSNTVGGNGGNGTLIDINGISFYYAGGGGGAGSTTLGAGGLGGGGAGKGVTTGTGIAGTPNTGGGGGGSLTNVNEAAQPGGNGGSGIVIIRVPTLLASNITLSDGLWNTNSLSFNNVDTGVDFSNSAFAQTTTTLSAWVYLNSNNEEVIWVKQSDNENSYNLVSIGFYSASNGWKTAGTAGNIYYHGANAQTLLSSNINLNTNQWYHIVVEVSPSVGNIYVNGVLDKQVAGNYAWSADTTVTSQKLGLWLSSGGGGAFYGKMEDVAIWNRILSSSEVSDLYRKGISRLDLNIYSCSDANCINKTSASYLTSIQNGSLIDLNSTVLSSRYLGFDAYFKKAIGLDDLNANSFYVGSFIKDINFVYLPGILNLSARTSANGYSWTDWSILSQSSPQTLSISDANFFQYKSNLSTSVTSVSPVLRDVNVTYSRISN